MNAQTKPIRVSLDLDPDLYGRLTQWITEITPEAGYRTRIPTAVVLRTCIELLTTLTPLQKAVVKKLLED